MGGWGEFGLAIVSFFLSHTVPAQAGIRDHLTDRLGQRGYAVIYSLVSLLILGWVLSAAGRAPYVQVIPPWEILRWAPLVLMPFACLVAVAGMLVQNPFSFGGLGRTAFDPDNPGILAVTRHPLLLALLIWSLAHMLANGSLAHVLVFGAFAAFAGLGMAVIDRRNRQKLGRDWDTLAAKTSLLSPTGLWQVDWGLPAVVSAGIFLVLIIAHMPVIGVSPLP